MDTLQRSSALYGKNLISIKDLKKGEIENLISFARERMHKKPGEELKGKILGICFHESSTRTRLSFCSAMARLGGQTIGYDHTSDTSEKKGESLADTMKMMESYCDAIVLRHPKQGAARLAADLIDKPVINAGDGAHEHPTQTLVDLFSMQQCFGQLDELRIALVGDLCHGRAVHSLALTAPLFKQRLYFVSPTTLEMPPEICRTLSEQGVRYSMHRHIEEIIDKVDVLYLTRIQKERLKSQSAIDAISHYYRVTPEMIKKGSPNLRIFHPLPRLDEIDPDCDALPQAYYFQQAANSVAVREALLMQIL